MNKFKSNKILTYVKKFFDVFLTFICALFIIVVIMQRVSDNKLSFFKYRLFTVVSGSMVPTYEIGDVLLAKEVKEEKLKKGDVICYSYTVQGQSVVITHRIVDVVKDKKGNYLTSNGHLVFRTRGDANLAEDPEVRGDQIIGVIKHKMFFLSIIYHLVSNQTGMFLLVVIPILYLIGSTAVGVLLDKEEKRRGIRK